MCRSSSSSRQVLEERQGLAQRPSADLVEREALEPRGRGVVPQPGPHAAGARHVVDHALELVPVDERDPPGLLDRREQALVLEREGAGPGPADVIPGVSRPVEDDPAGAAVEVVERGRQVEALGDGDRLDHPGEVGVGRRSRARRRPRPGGGSAARRGRAPPGWRRAARPGPGRPGTSPAGC